MYEKIGDMEFFYARDGDGRIVGYNLQELIMVLIAKIKILENKIRLLESKIGDAR